MPETERVTAGNREFPIMDGPNIPWAFIAPHDKQAERNHHQSLEVLAKRGGLSKLEALLVVTDKDWSDQSETDIEFTDKRLYGKVTEWRAGRGAEVAYAACAEINPTNPRAVAAEIGEAFALLEEFGRTSEYDSDLHTRRLELLARISPNRNSEGCQRIHSKSKGGGDG